MMLPFMLIFKAAISGLIWYIMREYGARRIYYFTNLGVSPHTLWGWSTALDLTIFAICTAAAIIYNFSWAA